jgi:hypothetical protein
MKNFEIQKKTLKDEQLEKKEQNENSFDQETMNNWQQIAALTARLQELEDQNIPDIPQYLHDTVKQDADRMELWLNTFNK